MHKTFEIAIKENIKARKAFTICAQNANQIAIDEVHSTWPDAKVEEVPEIDSKNMYRAQRMIDNFDMARDKIFGRADEIKLETPFKICLDTKLDITLFGRVDVLVIKNNGKNIDNIDYKSTKASWEYKEVPPQLLRYCIGYSIQNNFPIENIRSVLFNLESGNIPTRNWTAKEANSMIDYIVDTVVKIREMDPKKTPAGVGSHCRTLCQYQPSCPAFREALAKGKV